MHHHPVSLAHDDGCSICRRGRAHRRGEMIREAGRYAAILSVLVVIAALNALAHLLP